MKPALDKWLNESLREYARDKEWAVCDLPAAEFSISKDLSQGDFASNIAFKLSKIARIPSIRFAEEFVDFLKVNPPTSVARVELGGAGFINVYLAKTSLTGILHEIRKQDRSYGTTPFGKHKRVLIEFVSANPTGPLTIAHGRQAVIGDTLVRLLNAAGFAAEAEYYLNDAGRQMNLLGKSLWSRYRQELGVPTPLPEDGYQGDYLIDIARELIQQKGSTLLEDSQPSFDQCRLYAQDVIMRGILADLKSVDVHFHRIFSERSLYENQSVEAAFEDLMRLGHLYEKEGALWFQSTTFGDDKDRVVRKSSGELTYIAPDIAYHREKFKRGYEWLVDLMGPDHHGYITRLKASCQALGYDPSQLDVRIVQLTTLYRKGEPVRMSTRAGEFVTLRELVSEVGPDAARFFFLMRKVDTHLDFDLDLAKDKSQDNPVYYLQYAHARISGILRNFGYMGEKEIPTACLNTSEETALIKILYEYTNTIIAAAEALEPYRMVDYLRELAASFHKFYSAHRVISENSNLTEARVLLVDAVRIILRNGLNLLGVSAPESM